MMTEEQIRKGRRVPLRKLAQQSREMLGRCVRRDFSSIYRDMNVKARRNYRRYMRGEEL